MEDIKHTRSTIDVLMDKGFIPEPNVETLEKALKVAVDAIK